MRILAPFAVALFVLALAACEGGEQEQEEPFRAEEVPQRDVEPAATPESWEQAEETWQSTREESDALWDRVTERTPDLDRELQRALQSCVVLSLRRENVSEDEAFQECREEVEAAADDQPEADSGEDDSPPGA